MEKCHGSFCRIESDWMMQKRPGYTYNAKIEIENKMTWKI